MYAIECRNHSLFSSLGETPKHCAIQRSCGIRIAPKTSRRKQMSAIAQPTLQTGIAAHRSKAKTRYDDWAPTTKVSAGALGGAATILLTAFLAHWTQKD